MQNYKFNLMKVRSFVLIVACVFMTALSSCYKHTFAIGEGPQTGVTSQGKNNFFLFGLVPGKVTDPQALAGDAKDFEVTEVHTFVDGLLGVITFGIYTPTTTMIQK